MSVRFDTSGETLIISSGVFDYNANYTLMGWFYQSVDTAAIKSLAGPCDGTTTNRDLIRVSATNVLQSRVNGTNTSGSTLSSSTWYHLTMVRSSTTALDLYLNGVADGTTNTTSVSGRAAATRIEIGATVASTNPFNGRAAAIKIWTTNLSAAEILQEVQTIRPQKFASLWGFWPGFPGSGERTRDYSGNGRAWSETGTLSDEDPPSISWGSAIWMPPFAAAVTPADRLAPTIGIVPEYPYYMEV